MLSKTIFAVALVLAATAAPTLVQSKERVKTDDVTQGGTTEENAACRRDTRRLCRHVKVDDGNNAFLSCLQEHRAKLSKACDEVLKSHGL
jgi:hypothetical protein